MTTDFGYSTPATVVGEIKEKEQPKRRFGGDPRPRGAEIDRMINELAKDGPFTTNDLAKLMKYGNPSGAILRRIQKGELVRVGKGMYDVPSPTGKPTPAPTHNDLFEVLGHWQGRMVMKNVETSNIIIVEEMTL